MTHTSDLESAAKAAAGNWKHFQCFAWSRGYDLEDSERWTIVYTHNRDSGLLAESNSAAIDKILNPFTEGDDPDCVPESHSHWAVGWVGGYSIRVFREDGTITDAFKAWHEIQESLSDYPILDEDDYSDREYEATLDNMKDAAYSLAQEYALPDGWESDVFSWLWDSCEWQGELENTDDQGGYPSEESLRAAFDALGYPKSED